MLQSGDSYLHVHLNTIYCIAKVFWKKHKVSISQLVVGPNYIRGLLY